MNDYCFVIQPFDKKIFDKRYDDIFRPVIEDCGLTAYRVDRDYKADIPVEAIEEKITGSALVLAEISTNNPNVWFELGYALALNKPIVIVCSDERRGKTPFDIRHRQILRYLTGSTSDFELFKEELKKSIRAHYQSPDEESSENPVSKTERMILHGISRLQGTPYSITRSEHLLEEVPRECLLENLRSLVKKGLLEFLFAEQEKSGYYRLTEKGESLLKER